MSISKVIKGWREVIKLTALKKGRRLYFSKPSVPTVAKYEGKSTNSRNQLITPKFTSRFLRSFFSRASALVAKHNFIPLHPRYAGRLRRVPVFSLLGFCLATDMMKCPPNNKSMPYNIENTMTDTYIKYIFKDYKWEPQHLKFKPQSLNDLFINETTVIGNGCEGAVFEAKLKSNLDAAEDIEQENFEKEYTLAVKAVFNFYAESNASSILQKFNKEIVPLQPSDSNLNQIDEIINTSSPRLPPHPNIVDMYCVFVDDMLVTEEGQRKFSAAMPQRVNPEVCYGRNKTIHLVMRKCTTELSEYLRCDLPMKTRCLLLMQLLEAVCHMSSHGVAHRDIKANNILISLLEPGSTPHLQICDFGCCLAEKDKCLEIPYVSSDTNLGGNVCLMAPEISCAKPGKDSVLDFRKSDLWACGTLAYEIMGMKNPFYRGSAGYGLKSQTYAKDDLPPLPDYVPAPIQRLVKSILARDPKKRPSPAVAVLVVQLVILNSFTVRKQRQHTHLFKKRQGMELISDEVLNWIRRMGSRTTPLRQDIIEISKFFCLSRLTDSCLDEALRFFH